MTTVDATTIETPCGPFSMLARGDTVLASGWTTDLTELAALIAPAARPVEWRSRRDLGVVTAAVRAYFAGDLSAATSVDVSQQGGPFIQLARQQLRQIRPGATVTYRELAARSGRPDAIRAAASACSRNPTALFVPCHRVVRTGGDLGGFRWGLPVKRWLLDHESDGVSRATAG
ncbi:MAG: methylated-DNA--[protein]-cysteine S-methyltransferase [Actinomycetota bacterium]|nr:methylated-DNA--[protein]-cysteine S-methyltransferase [Actinomycetota bacterium]